MLKINKNISFNKEGPPKLIAEISCNHIGSKSLFLKHIIAAKKAGADMVKIQTYESSDMIVNKNFKIKSGLWKNKNLNNLYKKAETPFKWHKDAFKLAKKLKITLFSSPFSERAVQFLKKFNPSLYKIASFEITDLNLIELIAKTKKPIIMSTGLAKDFEIIRAINVIKKYHKKIILLHCVSGYPTPIDEANLENIERLKKITKIQYVGFSDHTKGIYASTIASNYKICAVEKHFILNKKINSPDKKFSITPKELKKLKNNIIKNYSMKKINKKKSEIPSLIFRRSVYAIKDINKDEFFTKQNIQCFRPMTGIGAEEYPNILGKKAKNKIKKFTPIYKKNFS
tara:strand:- start:616 stop:1641 length:1026 start_codon:yes stop_codon:yes gene_type:complete